MRLARTRDIFTWRAGGPAGLLQRLFKELAVQNAPVLKTLREEVIARRSKGLLVDLNISQPIDISDKSSVTMTRYASYHFVTVT